MRDCNLGPAGAEQLARAFEQWPCLRVLSINRNALGDEGVVALLAAPLPALEELRLCVNEIGEQGAAAIAAASPRLPKLRVLASILSSIDESGARALAQAHFPQLERLYLQGNNIGAEGQAALDAARHRWPKVLKMRTDQE